MVSSQTRESPALSTQPHSAIAEEVSQERPAFHSVDAGDHLDLVSQASIAKQIMDAARGAGLLIPCPEHHSGNSRGEDGSRAHHAGFESDNKSRIVESPFAPLGRCGANRLKLGVRGWIFSGFTSVLSATDDNSGGIDDDGANRDIARLTGIAGFGERERHEGVVLGGSAQRHPFPLPGVAPRARGR